jgi:hypothetical protein
MRVVSHDGDEWFGRQRLEGRADPRSRNRTSFGTNAPPSTWRCMTPVRSAGLCDVRRSSTTGFTERSAASEHDRIDTKRLGWAHPGRHDGVEWLGRAQTDVCGRLIRRERTFTSAGSIGSSQDAACGPEARGAGRFEAAPDYHRRWRKAAGIANDPQGTVQAA